MTSQSTRIYAPIIIGVSIFFTIFGLKPLYTSYMDASIVAESTEQSKVTKQKTLDELTLMKQSFESATGSTELTEKVKKLASKWSEADILSSIMLNDFTKGTEFTPAPITITSITLDAGKKLPSGLSLGTIGLTISGKSIDDIVEFLTYLTNSASYIYTLDTISLPISTLKQDDTGGLSLPITLGVYYYE